MEMLIMFCVVSFMILLGRIVMAKQTTRTKYLKDTYFLVRNLLVKQRTVDKKINNKLDILINRGKDNEE